MAKPNNTTTRTHLTLERIRKADCPAGKQQHILWDDSPRSLGLRITAKGAKAFIFEYRIHGKNRRTTIGQTDAWDIATARKEAARLQTLVDSGIDPREEKAEKAQKADRKRKEAARQTVTLGQLWPAYIEANENRWSESHRRDHRTAMQAPGQPRKRSRELTKAGPLYALSDVRLVDLTADRVQRWLQTESATRPTVTARAFRLLRAFLNWCNEETAHAGLADPGALKARKVQRAVATPKAKSDTLQREMLGEWFKAVQMNADPVIPAYLEALLLTGSRREEMAKLKWADVDFRWQSLTIGDKVEGQRVIPLTPYLAQRLSALPRRNEWVFSSATSASGRLRDAYRAHQRATQTAGLPNVTLHGLRRSFGTLSEWVECPVGIVAQIQGHKPSATAEKHYRQRPLDLLRLWHSKIESWILEQADIRRPHPDNLQKRLFVV